MFVYLFNTLVDFNLEVYKAYDTKEPIHKHEINLTQLHLVDKRVLYAITISLKTLKITMESHLYLESVIRTI